MSDVAELNPEVVETPHGQWEQNPAAATDTWNRQVAPNWHCHVSQYPESASYFWQAVRGGIRLSGIEYGRDVAMKQADETMALPDEEFNNRVISDLMEDLHRIELDILRLSPNTVLLPGYQAGYEAGAADVRKRVEAAIGLGDGEPS